VLSSLALAAALEVEAERTHPTPPK
jgi:hypothetical protein